MAIPSFPWLSLTERRRLYRWGSATKENRGGSCRCLKTARNVEKRRQTATSLSIGDSLRRSIPATVAAEANRK
ncbi:unnamed protein product [Brassica rapa subsp. trilocularis]|uniref:Uncharacterized protein n=1 Tax=Brassica campestris TaxID=3711 RepID=M4CCN5_BRACM